MQGIILQPICLENRRVRFWISPTGRDLKFGARALQDLGQLHVDPQAPDSREIDVSLLLPESAAATAMTCLGAMWKYIALSTLDEDEYGLRIGGFSFHATKPAPQMGE